MLANRLSADPKNRVLLLEAGGKDNWIWFHIPVGYLFAIGNPRSDWMFKTEPEPGLNGRALNYPRGKVIGGSSAINAMIYMRGQAADYDHWRQLGLTGWGWDDVLPLFRKQTDHFLGDSEHHGVGGEWRIEAPRVHWDLLDAFRKAAEEYGIKPIDDFNRGDNEGSAYFHVNQKTRAALVGGARLPQAGAEPAEPAARNRLPGRTRRVRRLARDRRALAAGRRDANARAARARSSSRPARSARRSCCCCPASGRDAICSNLGIPVVLDRPGVGQNLQDHLQLRMIYKVSGVKTLNETYHSLFGRAAMGLDYALRRRGPLTMAPSQLGLFTRSDPVARARQHPVSRAAALARQVRRPAAHLSGLHHQRVQSPAGEPRLGAAALGRSGRQAGDRAALSVGRGGSPRRGRIRSASRARIVAQPALQKFKPVETLPGEQVRSDDDAALAKAAGDIGTTIFHPVGTAKMGLTSDPNAVVDARLRVLGIEGLRVIDASVMPTITSGNTNSPTMMIAEKGAADGAGRSKALIAR